MMKKILLFLFCVNILIPTFIFEAKGDTNSIYINPGAPEFYIKHFFSKVVTDRIFPMRNGWTDNTVYTLLLRKWKNCLYENNTRISTDCIIDICDSVYNHIEYGKRTDKLKEEFRAYCTEFALSLKSVKGGQNPSCRYEVKLVGTGDGQKAPQQSIRYEDVNGGSLTYTKSKGNLAWRMNNPGNITWSRLQCALVDIYQGRATPDRFATFATSEIGWVALRNLLRNPDSRQKYPDQTIAVAMSIYAPAVHDNNPWTYGRKLKQNLTDKGLYNPVLTEPFTNCADFVKSKGLYERMLSEARTIAINSYKKQTKGMSDAEKDRYFADKGIDSVKFAKDIVNEYNGLSQRECLVKYYYETVKVGQLTEAELETMMNAISQYEGNTAGDCDGSACPKSNK